MHEVCDLAVDFTVWDSVSAETVYSSEMTDINSESCRNMSAKCHSVLALIFHCHLALHIVGDRALCYENWLSLHTLLKFAGC